MSDPRQLLLQGEDSHLDLKTVRTSPGVVNVSWKRIGMTKVHLEKKLVSNAPCPPESDREAGKEPGALESQPEMEC